MNCFNALNMKTNAENYHNAKKYYDEEKSIVIRERIKSRVCEASLLGRKEISFYWDIDSDLADYICAHPNYYVKLGFKVYSCNYYGHNKIVINWES